ncbi:MAG: ATP-dependent Clp protease ATP-binding subunit [Clostridiales bacterium]|nr:ATP-dependent Clp protease ATP-binding subunit [Clostridiales bacterium]
MDYFARFTEGAKQSLMKAAAIAKELGHNYVATEHLLAGIVSAGGHAARILVETGLSEDVLKQAILETDGKGDYIFNNNFGYTPRCKQVLELSKAIARQLGNNYIGSEHMLYAILKEDDCLANRIMQEIGVNTAQVEQAILSITTKNEAPQDSAQQAKTQENGGSTPNLEKFGTDLTKLAKEGALDPVIGRATEISRIIQILIRRTKNNPVLVGEPGVGKSAIAEGLAQRIVEGNIPEMLKDKRVISLDLAGMIAGAKYRGEFEERFKSAIEELKNAGNVVLFIDELHTIVGAGAAEGSLDAANMLKPMLARGEIQVIGATTMSEYRKYIEKDAALERRFAPVEVGEPTKEEALEILKGLRDKYEAHHKVRISDEALSAAVEYSSRYISDRFLPDKAIDLMDEAASKVRIRMYIAPPDMKNLEEEISRIAAEKEQAVAHQDYEKAAQLRDRERELKKQMDETKQNWEKERSADNGAEVTEEDIAEIVSDWTHVPVSKLAETESEKLLHLEELLHERVVGQGEAVDAVAKAIRRARAGLKDPKRPIGSFIFLGPTGVGKTELTKALASAMFGSEDAMIRLDMSEYMEKHTVSKLIGSPPGYVGFDDGGQLTEKVRRRPYSVVLFDEIEKAHPDIFNTLLQILDDGRLTDSHGRTVDFKNTVIIMTSNVGASSIGKRRAIGFAANNEAQVIAEHEKMKETLMSELKQSFRPEFLNRVDDIIVFHKLDESNTREIAQLMLKTVAKRLEERDVHISFTEETVDKLAKQGFDSEYGARPLRRVIQQSVEDALSEELLKGSISFGDQVEMYVDGENYAFRRITQSEEKTAE